MNDDLVEYVAMVLAHCELRHKGFKFTIEEARRYVKEKNREDARAVIAALGDTDRLSKMSPNDPSP